MDFVWHIDWFVAQHGQNNVCEEKLKVIIGCCSEVTGPNCSAKVAMLHPTLDETVGDGQAVHTDLQVGVGVQWRLTSACRCRSWGRMTNRL